MLRRTPLTPSDQEREASEEARRRDADEEALRATRHAPSQRGLHWIEWLSQRPGRVRPVAVAIFVLMIGWMCVTRWSACWGGSG